MTSKYELNIYQIRTLAKEGGYAKIHKYSELIILLPFTLQYQSPKNPNSIFDITMCDSEISLLSRS